MLNEHKFSKYLIYAIGEISLVVIGILIALAVNNWNKHQQDLSKERIYLSQMLDDLKLQADEIKITIKIEQIDSVAITRIASAINAGFQGIDNVQFNDDLANLGDTRTFNVFSTTYEELRSSGNISIISNINLKQRINAYYQNLRRFQKVLNKNSSETNRFRLEDLYRKGFMLLDYKDLNIGTEGEGFQSLGIKSHIKDDLRNVAMNNIQKKENLLLLYNAVSSRWVICYVNVRILETVQTSIDTLISEIEEEVGK